MQFRMQNSPVTAVRHTHDSLLPIADPELQAILNMSWDWTELHKDVVRALAHTTLVEIEKYAYGEIPHHTLLVNGPQ
ncbi:hypothetical protein MHYP_G00006060 [Metynnis hypsauchen]